MERELKEITGFHDAFPHFLIVESIMKIIINKNEYTGSQVIRQ